MHKRMKNESLLKQHNPVLHDNKIVLECKIKCGLLCAVLLGLNNGMSLIDDGKARRSGSEAGTWAE